MNKQLKQYGRIVVLLMTPLTIGGDLNAGLGFSRSVAHDDESPRSAVGARGSASQAETFEEICRELANREKTRAKRSETLGRETRELGRGVFTARFAPANQKSAGRFFDKVFDLFDID